MSEQFLFVFCYDTPSDERRRRLVRLLRDVADRIQGSVFEGWLTQEQRDEVWRRLAGAVDLREDSLRCYRCCSYCRDGSLDLQLTDLNQQAGIWIV